MSEVRMSEQEFRSFNNTELAKEIMNLFDDHDLLTIAVTLTSVLGFVLVRGGDTLDEFVSIKRSLDELMESTAQRWYDRKDQKVKLNG